jgi:GNAT superfamily N-acetyltransferase
MQLPAIRVMTGADVDRTADAIQHDGWGERRIKMAFVAAHPKCAPFVAEADGAIVGTGIATINGSVGWIGTIWVDQAWRRRGLGRALTIATMDAAEAAGCRTLILVATTLGLPLYEGLGFEIQTWYRIVETPGLDGGPVESPVRPFRPSDLPSMGALDAAATGEDRGHLLAAFATSATTLCLDRPDGALGGFVVRAPWGGGATIAPDADDALAILQARRLAAGPDKRVRAGLLADNEAGLDLLASAGWTDSWHAPRLVRGPMPDWTPSAIWGQFDHATG